MGTNQIYDLTLRWDVNEAIVLGVCHASLHSKDNKEKRLVTIQSSPLGHILLRLCTVYLT